MFVTNAVYAKYYFAIREHEKKIKITQRKKKTGGGLKPVKSFLDMKELAPNLFKNNLHGVFGSDDNDVVMTTDTGEALS